MNAPFSWPKSSLSSSVRGIAAQLIVTNGSARSRLLTVDARATSSLPVPVSPRMSTVASVGETMVSILLPARPSRIARLSPTISSKL